MKTYLYLAIMNSLLNGHLDKYLDHLNIYQNTMTLILKIAILLMETTIATMILFK